MKLHQDINAFRVLLEQIHERTGYRTDVLEKDYYVVLMLRELAEKRLTRAERIVEKLGEMGEWKSKKEP